jgi:hypothetical protein
MYAPSPKGVRLDGLIWWPVVMPAIWLRGQFRAGKIGLERSISGSRT